MLIKNILKIAVLAVAAGGGTQTWSIPLSDVGEVDSMVASTNLGSSGEAEELAWVESVLGVSDLVFDTKMESGFNWMAIDDMVGVWAQELESDPGYFLVKAGKKSTVGPNHTHFLFENLNDFSWAVIDLQDLGFDPDKVNFSKISHISEFGQQTTVSEPSVLALVGLGLLGLSVARRRKATN